MMGIVDEISRLIAVDLLIEDAVKEGILHGNVSTVPIIAGLTTKEKVSPKSMPGG